MKRRVFADGDWETIPDTRPARPETQPLDEYLKELGYTPQAAWGGDDAAMSLTVWAGAKDWIALVAVGNRRTEILLPAWSDLLDLIAKMAVAADLSMEPESGDDE